MLKGSTITLQIGSPEELADRQLCALNEVASGYACGESVKPSTYRAAERAMEQYGI
jgi:hypothetical protein